MTVSEPLFYRLIVAQNSRSSDETIFEHSRPESIVLLYFRFPFMDASWIFARARLFLLLFSFCSVFGSWFLFLFTLATFFYAFWFSKVKLFIRDGTGFLGWLGEAKCKKFLSRIFLLCKISTGRCSLICIASVETRLRLNLVSFFCKKLFVQPQRVGAFTCRSLFQCMESFKPRFGSFRKDK